MDSLACLMKQGAVKVQTDHVPCTFDLGFQERASAREKRLTAGPPLAMQSFDLGYRPECGALSLRATVNLNMSILWSLC